MSRGRFDAMAARVLDAWNTQDVEQVVACYTDDLVYRDPNTGASCPGRRRCAST